MENEIEHIDVAGGPWKVEICGPDTLEETLNDFVAGGYLVHSIYQDGHFTVCGIDQSFVQGVNLLTEDQAKELKDKLDESNVDTCKV